MITITTFKWVPDFIKGYVRDVPLRWALEEIGEPYRVRLIGFGDLKTEAYRRLQPFGKVPVIEDDGLTLFESGSILLHIGEKSEKILPRDPASRARARTWVFAAMTSLDPFIWNFNQCKGSNEGWTKEAAPQALASLKEQLAGIEKWMAGREWLEDQFTVGEIMMTTSLRNLGDSGVLDGFPNLTALLERCTARPAFKRALSDHMRTFSETR